MHGLCVKNSLFIGKKAYYFFKEQQTFLITSSRCHTSTATQLVGLYMIQLSAARIFVPAKFSIFISQNIWTSKISPVFLILQITVLSCQAVPVVSRIFNKHPSRYRLYKIMRAFTLLSILII